MAGLSISNAVVALDGVEFTAAADGREQKFLVNRDALEDLEYTLFESDEPLMQAFHRHRVLIAEVAARALTEGRGGARTVVLQNLIL